MAAAAWTQVQALPQQVPLQPRPQSWPLSRLPGLAWLSTVLPGACIMPCDICVQWCSEGAADNVACASVARKGVTASARVIRKSENR